MYKSWWWYIPSVILLTCYVTLNFDCTHDLHLRFSVSNFEIAVSQEWEGQLTWNKMDVTYYVALKSDLTYDPDTEFLDVQVQI